MPGTTSLISAPSVVATTLPRAVSLENRDRYLVLLAAVLALVVKVTIALNTLGTNDTAAFYRFGQALTEHGLESTYLGNVAFNHPPLVAGYIRAIYWIEEATSLRDYGMGFPFLLRFPGIVADFVVVMVLLSVAQTFRLPTWSVVVLALSPVSLMVSGFHGNTDPIMVMFAVLAAWMCLKKRPGLCGLFLALSCQIKIIPILLIPAFFFFWMERRRTLVFTLPFAATLIALWTEPLLRFPGVFIQRVLSYGSFWGLWGVTYWLRMTGVRDFAPVTYYNFLPLQQIAATTLKLVIIAAVLGLAWRRRKLDADGLFKSLACVWVIFFILSPGFGAQYLVWLMPFVLVLSPQFFAWLTAASSVFLFVFYNAISGGLPWYFGVSTGQIKDQWVPWALWPWAVLIVGGYILWRRAVEADPSLRIFSIAEVSPAGSSGGDTHS